MYLEHFGLNKKPFSTTPDPRFLYLSDKHREGLAHLLFGTRVDSSFVLLTGEIGTGKTTLCRTLVDKHPDYFHVALILNPLQTPFELLASICDEFGITYKQDTQSRKVLVDGINKFLLQKHSKHHRCIVIIDEAQNLSSETLEQVRLLTNLETGDHKLLKIMLIGQPELKSLLERPELKQLNQRITARYHLMPLSEQETAAYISHRMNKAGSNTDIFSRSAAKKLYKLANGVPRVINLIAERALLGAYALNRRTIDKKLISRAAKEVLGQPAKNSRLTLKNTLTATSFILGLLAISLVIGNMYLSKKHQQPVVAERITPAKKTTVENNTEISPPSTEINLTAVKQAEAATMQPPEVKIPAAPSQKKQVELQTLLSQQMNQPDAIDSLFTRWGISSSSFSGDSACEKAAQAKLGCIYNKGNFNDLVSYDRPAVLELTDKDNKRHQILLTALKDKQAEVIIDGQQQTIKVQELLQTWNGDYLMFWKLPPNGAQTVQPGSDGKSVAWLNANLDTLLGNSPENPAPRYFGEDLKEKLISFQVMAGLEADGIAGPRTLIKLATFLAEANTPTLIPSQLSGAQ